MIVAHREDIAEQLWLRGEEALAKAVLDVDAETLARIFDVAGRPFTGGFRTSVDDLLVAAAIQVLAGKRRRPAVRKPLPDRECGGLWAVVGVDRDRREPGRLPPGLKDLFP